MMNAVMKRMEHDKGNRRMRKALGLSARMSWYYIDHNSRWIRRWRHERGREVR